MKEGRWSAFRPVLIGMIGLIGLLGGFMLWATMTQIAGAIIAPGRIEVDQNRQVVQHPIGGVVDSIAVKEGDVVEAGDVLIELDAEQLASRLAIVEGQLFELMARRGRLEAERDGTDTLTYPELLVEMSAENPDVQGLMIGQENLFEARRESIARETEQLEKRKAQISNQIDGIRAQQVSLSRQLELIEEELANQRSLLDRGLAQASSVLNLERNAASL
ncbi:MAG: biotin/lipoyl-binding protein, partial [Pseudomonadota bacterium]